MGTRSLTRVFNKDVEILCLYRQFDGYPSGHGAELAAFVASRPFVNGISETRVFNGMGCFAAQLVAHMKHEAGGFYIYAPGSKDCGEEFVYEVRGGLGFDFAPLPIVIKVFSGSEAPLYEGDVAGFVAFCSDEQEEAA